MFMVFFPDPDDPDAMEESDQEGVVQPERVATPELMEEDLVDEEGQPQLIVSAKVICISINVT